jgi:hypothetical protein
MRSCREVAQVPNFEGTERGPELLAGVCSRGGARASHHGDHGHTPPSARPRLAECCGGLATGSCPSTQGAAAGTGSHHDARRSLRGSESRGRAGSPRPPREPPAARPMRADPPSPPGATSRRSESRCSTIGLSELA